MGLLLMLVKRTWGRMPFCFSIKTPEIIQNQSIDLSNHQWVERSFKRSIDCNRLIHPSGNRSITTWDFTLYPKIYLAVFPRPFVDCRVDGCCSASRAAVTDAMPRRPLPYWRQFPDESPREFPWWFSGRWPGESDAGSTCWIATRQCPDRESGSGWAARRPRKSPSAPQRNRQLETNMETHGERTTDFQINYLKILKDSWKNKGRKHKQIRKCSHSISLKYEYWYKSVHKRVYMEKDMGKYKQTLSSTRESNELPMIRIIWHRHSRSSALSLPRKRQFPN